MPFCVYLCSKSPKKFEEFQKHFSRYNVNVVVSDDAEIQEKVKNTRMCLGHIIERGWLSKIDDPNNLELNFDEWLKNPQPLAVIFHSDLIWVNKKNDEVKYYKYYKDSCKGYLFPLSLLNRTPDPNSFGWDSYFFAHANLQPYTEFKLSPRDRNISRMICDISSLHYKNLISWKHIDNSAFPSNDKVIDFSVDPFLIFDQVLPKTQNVRKHFQASITRVANLGTFIKRPNSKRLGVYWVPGLNNGIPENPKPDDPMHEKVFFFHDVTHHLLPDFLLLDNDPFFENLYSLLRLCSEPITLAIADMMFVSCCSSDGIEYPTVDKRKIFQLYIQKFGTPECSHLNKENIRNLLKSTINYAILGDKNELDIESFRKKFDGFMVQDLLWSRTNAKYLREHHSEFKTWYNKYKVVIKSLELVSVRHFFEKIINTTPIYDARSLVETVTDAILEHFLPFVSPSDDVPKLLSFEERRKKGFLRWALGQMVFFEFEGKLLQNYQMWEHMLNHCIFSSKEQDFISLWNLMLHKAYHDDNVITFDDYETYKWIYPIFPASYVLYDYEETRHSQIVSSFCKELFESFQKWNYKTFVNQWQNFLHEKSDSDSDGCYYPPNTTVVAETESDQLDYSHWELEKN